MSIQLANWIEIKTVSITDCTKVQSKLYYHEMFVDEYIIIMSRVSAEGGNVKF